MKKHYNTILSFLETCRSFSQLKQLHGLMITTTIIKDIIPLSKLIDFCTASEKPMYLNYAKLVFTFIDHPSVYIWNSLIRGYSSCENPHEALILYRDMKCRYRVPDNFTFPFVLRACSILNDPIFGKCVHKCIVKTGFEDDVYSSTGLLNMYSSCHDMESVLKVFDKMPKWNVVAWTSLIAGFVNNGQPNEATLIFMDMVNSNVEPNEITTVHVLVACGRTRDIGTGKRVHNHIRRLGFDPFSPSVSLARFNVILATAIIDMYAKCGSLSVARTLLDKMPKRNLVAWNSFIAAYNQHGRSKDALALFTEMQNFGLTPDKATFLSLLEACANISSLACGQSLHACVVKSSMDNNTAIGTALVDMYAKTGDLISAQQIFSQIEDKDSMAWTCIIIGLAMNGNGHEALRTFQKMQECGNVVPDEITYIGVLSACSHLGLVDQGQQYFDTMVCIHKIMPIVEHYGCMVDLLSRAGRFNEAEKLVEKMPTKPNVAICGSLLSGCEIYENVALADRLRKRIEELQPSGSGVYVLLSNIYARAGRWLEVCKTRGVMKHRKISKNVSHSLVETKL